MPKAKVLVVRTAGTNCDKETAEAFTLAKANVKIAHINRIFDRTCKLEDYQILAFPGGFSYGDDFGAGKILAGELKNRLKDELSRFINSGKLIIGICNGFQALVKSGILPGNPDFSQEATLMLNDSGKFEARWVHLKTQSSKLKAQNCVWAKDLPEIIYLPVAHGEGKFQVKDDGVLRRLRDNGQIVFKYFTPAGDACSTFKGFTPDGKGAVYPYNPNGSVEDIAGICDDTGRVLGLMPHPERNVFKTQEPRWTYSPDNKQKSDGSLIFENGVNYALKNI